MKMIARYFSLILITGILLASTGCIFVRDHGKHGPHDGIEIQVDRDDRRDNDNRGNRDEHEDNSRHEKHDNRR